MMRVHVLLLAIALCLKSAFAAAEDKTDLLDAASIMPRGAVAFVELDQLERWIQKAQDSDFVKSLPANPQLQEFLKSPQGQQADAGRRILEAQIGMDLWTLGKKVFGGRISAAFYPVAGRKEPDAIIFLQAPESGALNTLREKAQPFLALAQDRIETTTGAGDISIRGFDKKLFVAEKDHWLLLASTRELAEQALSFKAGQPMNDAKPLLLDAPFVAMQKQTGGLEARHLARVYLNAEMVKQAQGGRVSPQKLDNGFGSLLLGGLNELLNHTPFAAATLSLNEQQFALGLHLGAKGSALPATYSPFFPPKDQAIGPLPDVPGLIAGWTLNRDFAGWYQRREELLQPKVLPEFDKFESGLANILPNRDYGSDILPTIGRNLTLVAAPQSFAHLNSKPGLQLPGFGFIVDLAKPEEGAEILQLLLQTLTSIANLNAGQQGREPWLLSAETYRDVQIQFGKYSQKPKGERLPIIFNFMPAGARVGNRYVVCSSIDLCRQLIDASKALAAERSGMSPQDFRFEARGSPLAKALEVNQELLEARSVQEGKSPEQAKLEVTTLFKLLRAIDSFRITTGEERDGYELRVEAKWAQP